MKEEIEKLIAGLEAEAETHKRYASIYRENQLCQDMFQTQSALYNMCLRTIRNLRSILK